MLFRSLLASRLWQEDPGRFDRYFEIQSIAAREREWGFIFPDDASRQAALDAVEKYFVDAGAQSKDHMDNGYDLEATILRRGLPFSLDVNTQFSEDWIQVCERVSQSENGLARWEVVAASPTLAAEAKAVITRIARQHGAGEEYQG